MLCLFTALNLNAQNLQSEITNYFGTELQKFNIPNIDMLIVQGDSLIIHESYGQSSVLDNQYFIGSSSKSFTALGVLKLIQEDKLSLETNVTEIIPEMTFGGSDRMVTVKNLLHHTSGIPGKAGFENLPSLHELNNSSLQIKLDFTPGETHEYSNLNYVILGLIIEMISGESYCNYMYKNIFKPLEMTYTICESAEVVYKKNLTQYQYFGPFPFKSKQVAYAITSIPAGFIVSTATDLAHYLEMNLNGGKYKDQQILQPELLELMHTSWDGSNFGYAIGWKKGDINGKTFLQHLGSTATSYSGIFIFPQEKIGFAMLSNSNSLSFTEELMTGMIQIIADENPEPASRFEFYLRTGVLIILLLMIVSFLSTIYKLIKSKLIIEKKKERNKLVISSIILFVVIIAFPQFADIPFFTLLQLQPDIGSAILVSLVVPIFNSMSKLIFLHLKTEKNQNHVL